MNVLQITAFVPGKGEIPLLVFSFFGGGRHRITVRYGHQRGESLTMGGAIETPWADQISGAVFPAGRQIWPTGRAEVTLPVNGPGSSGDKLLSVDFC